MNNDINELKQINRTNSYALINNCVMLINEFNQTANKHAKETVKLAHAKILEEFKTL